MGICSNAHAQVAEIVYMLNCYCALGSARMNFFDLANLLDNDGNLQNEMMVMSFATTLLATIPVNVEEFHGVLSGSRLVLFIQSKCFAFCLSRVRIATHL